jgi:hypothetical protein
VKVRRRGGACGRGEAAAAVAAAAAAAAAVAAGGGGDGGGGDEEEDNGEDKGGEVDDDSSGGARRGEEESAAEERATSARARDKRGSSIVAEFGRWPPISICRIDGSQVLLRDAALARRAGPCCKTLYQGAVSETFSTFCASRRSLNTIFSPSSV